MCFFLKFLWYIYSLKNPCFGAQYLDSIMICLFRLGLWPVIVSFAFSVFSRILRNLSRFRWRDPFIILVKQIVIAPLWFTASPGGICRSKPKLAFYFLQFNIYNLQNSMNPLDVSVPYNYVIVETWLKTFIFFSQNILDSFLWSFLERLDLLSSSINEVLKREFWCVSIIAFSVMGFRSTLYGE